uniref:BspA family leucine-rich repeat surface protein n=1 Tax=Roseihalotalea indica TaxID=2867963 RepID=A0AA49GJT3_9BACT|nr:BspA family leucine-rich repeat surface protein [Tunicatimonas sp. TK19036]
MKVAYKLSQLFIFLLFAQVSLAQEPFITTWQVAGSDLQVKIPTTGEGYNYSVDWGDGHVATHISGDTAHTYSSAGTYTISISGDFPRIYFDFDNSIRSKILSVEQWGDIKWASMEKAFYGCSRLTIPATDVPDLSNVTDMSYMFGWADALNQNIGYWDVSNVTNMSNMFNSASNFNQDLSQWDVSNVTNMSYMFKFSDAFNQDIGDWDVSNVTDMSWMFYHATAFNQNIGNWDVSNVTNMDHMLGFTNVFNQSIGSWDVSNVTNMSLMFYYAKAFNQDISNWNVSSVINMNGMFHNAQVFNQNIGNWNVGNVTDMNRMFWSAEAFDQNLGNWNIQNVSGLDYMFYSAALTQANYDSTLIGWSTQEVKRDLVLRASASYCLGSDARNKLIDHYGWNISDYGRHPDCELSYTFIHSFVLESQLSEAIIDTINHTVSVKVANGTDISALAPAITISEGATIYPSSESMADFSNPVTYRVTAEDGMTWQEWTVTIIEYKQDEGLSAATDFLSFFLSEQSNDAIIDSINHHININVAQGTDITSLIPAFTLSQGASASPGSGTKVDFSAPVYYIITAADDTNTQTWTVVVTKDSETQSSNTDIFSFKLNTQTSSTIIDTASHIINAVVAFGTDVTALIPTFTLDEEAEIFPASGLKQNFSGSVIYKVTAEDGTVQDWTINISSARPLVTTWEVTSSDLQITIPTYNRYIYNYDVDWGDGKKDVGITGNATHRYDSAGIYTVSISGDLHRIYFDNKGDKDQLLTIEQWGEIEWRSMEKAFMGCSRLTIPATDAPDLSGVTNMSYMFYGATSFNQDISHWDVSNVDKMSWIFYQAETFNQDISSWNVSNVTDMSYMFSWADNFNHDIGSWDVSNVVDMSYMFYNALSFNQDISDWNVGNVKRMKWMLSYAEAFNQNLGLWNIINVTNMDELFSFTALSQNNYDSTLIGWAKKTVKPNIRIRSHVTYCLGANSREKLIATYQWEINDDGKAPECISSSANITSFIFNEKNGTPIIDFFNRTIDVKAAFNTDLSKLKPTLTISEGASIIPASETEQNFSGPVIYKITAEDGTVQDWTINISSARPLVTTWEVTSSDLQITIPALSILDDTHTVDWGDGRKDVGITGNATHRYDSAGIYTVSISGDLHRIYFNNKGDKDQLLTIEQWGEIEWGSMEKAFMGCSRLTIPATDAPDLSGVTNMSYMFYGATSFNQDISHWDVSNIIDMYGMFSHAETFNQDISSWNVSNVTSISMLFYNARSFNQPLSQWDVSNVTHMSWTFSGANSFNQDISQWDVSKVVNMSRMFSSNSIFNQDISQWDVSNVTTMDYMFWWASAFDQNIGSWDISNVISMRSMFFGSSLSQHYYDDILLGWATQEVHKGVNFGTPTSYCRGIEARDKLVNTYKWEIRDQGSYCSPENDFVTFGLNGQTGLPTIDKVNHTISIEVVHGTDVRDLIPTFTLSNGASTYPNKGTEVDFTHPFTYTVTASDGVTEQPWTIVVSVSKQEVASNTATNFLAFELSMQTKMASIDTVNHTIAVEVAYGTNITALNTDFILSEGAKAIPASNTIIDFSNPVIYTVTAEDESTTQEWTVTIFVAANTSTDFTLFTLSEQTKSAKIDTATHTISVKVAYGTDVTTLAPSFILSEGATAIPTSDSVVDFSNPVTYTVTAEDDSTTQEWNVLVFVAKATPLSTATNFLDFELYDFSEEALIDTLEHTIKVVMDFGVNVTKLKPVFSLSKGASSIPASDSVVDFSIPVTYTVTAEDDSTAQDWVITVSVAANTATDFTSFTLSEQTENANIDTATHTISVTVASSTNVTTLSPIYTLSEGATALPGSDSILDFSTPVIYTVTAADDSTAQEWTVFVFLAEQSEKLSTETDFLSYDLREQSKEAVINTEDHTVFLEVAYGTDVTALAPSFILSEGATAIPTSDSVVDFSNPVTYTVTAEDDSTTQEWSVTVSSEEQVLGIEDLYLECEVYPNPTNHLLSVKSITSIIGKITNLNGKTVLAEKTGLHLVFDLSKLKEGIYLLTIKDRYHTHTRKIIKTN